jgi:hypothetical protein
MQLKGNPISLGCDAAGKVKSEFFCSPSLIPNCSWMVKACTPSHYSGYSGWAEFIIFYPPLTE